jgi:NTP pyrophosphatase (non-canonical NTP hydrolase)
MNIEAEHEKMVAALVKNPETVKDELSPTDVDLWHGATGVATEAGELLDAVKKRVIYRRPIDLPNIIEELGDVEFYMAQVRRRLNITREETLEHNMRKLAERYKQYKYSDEQAQQRADKVTIP